VLDGLDHRDRVAVMLARARQVQRVETMTLIEVVG
jgi:hypothetical protein